MLSGSRHPGAVPGTEGMGSRGMSLLRLEWSSHGRFRDVSWRHDMYWCRYRYLRWVGCKCRRMGGLREDYKWCICGMGRAMAVRSVALVSGWWFLECMLPACSVE